MKLRLRGRIPPEPARLGIVLVHGIGFQRPGETLLEWCGAIETALVGWRTRIDANDLTPPDGDAPIDLVQRSDVDLTGSRRAYITMRVPGVESVPGAGPQRWTFTEAYWAAKIEPVSLRLVADWTGREGVIWRVVEGILKKNAPGRIQPIVVLAGKYWLGLFVSAFTSTALLGWMFVRSILSLIPIKAVRDFVAFGTGERFLVGWWGDARTLVRDPIQSATVRKSVDDSIRYLRKKHGCDRIAVIAHSGGTIVAYMTLSDPDLAASADLLITHGQAVELARRFEAQAEEPDVAQVRPSVTRIREVANPDDLRVSTWRDFYGTHDPAPIKTPSDLVPPTPARQATEVVNLRSIRGDHGGYWSNDEEFVLPVLQELERAASGAAVGQPSRFTRSGGGCGDEVGPERRRSRVAMRSLWGRFALVAPLVAIMLAAGISGGAIDDARGLDVPSDILADNYTRLPFNELALEISQALARATDGAVRTAAHSIAGATLFLLFLIGAVWALLPTGARSRLPGWASAADIGLSLAVVLAAVATIVQWGPLRGADRPASYDLAMIGLVIFAVGSAIVTAIWNRFNLSRFLPPSRTFQMWVSWALIVGIVVVIASVVLSFIVDEATRRWIVDGIAAILLFQLVVRIGMWRWNSWDAAERQWFRGARVDIPSRSTVHGIGILLATLVAALVVIVSGLDDALVQQGVNWMASFTTVTAVLAGLFVLGLLVRDASVAESR
jgi:hypothetical protein